MKRIEKNEESAWEDNQRIYWNLEAEYYDDLYKNKWSELEDDYKISLLRKNCSYLSSPRVLDLGCGTGLGVEFCKKSFTSFEYTGIDISESMILSARKKFPEYDFICNSFDEVDYSEFDKFDLIIGLYGTLSYSVNAKNLINKLEKATHENSIVIMSYYNIYSLSRVLRARFSKLGNIPTRNSRFSSGSPVQYYSKKEVFEFTDDLKIKEISIIGMSFFGRICEFCFLWPLDLVLSKLLISMSYMHVVIYKNGEGYE